MPQPDATERFVQLLAEHQNRLFGYIYSMLGDHSRAADVLQESNLVLWRKKAEFEADRPFLPWAFGIARNQVLAHLRDQKRDRCLLDAELVEKLASETEEQAGHLESVRTALRQCIELLGADSRDLVQRRYFRSTPIREIAESVDRSTGAVKAALLRARRQLADCVQKRIVTEG